MLGIFDRKPEKPTLESGDTYSGRRLYEAHMICGQNRRPVQTLMTAVTSAVQGTPELPVPLNMVTECLCVDGTTILLAGRRPIYDEVLYADDTEALVKVGRERFLLISISGTSASVQAYKSAEWNPETEKFKLGEAVGTAEVYQNSIIYPNGRGILYWPQRTLLRLEDIHQTLFTTTGLEAIMFVRGGGISAEALNNRIEAELSTNRPVMRLAAGEEIEQPSYSGLSMRLMNEAQILRSEWLEATYDYSTYPNESGVARRMLMQKFIAKTEELKMQCQEIYAHLGFTDLRFHPIDLTDPAEDTAQVDLMDRALANGVMSAEEYTDMFRDLLGLGELREGIGQRIGVNPDPGQTENSGNVV